jgi:hypothetical protein
LKVITTLSALTIVGLAAVASSSPSNVAQPRHTAASLVAAGIGKTSAHKLSTPEEVAAYRAALNEARSTVPSAKLLAEPQHTNLGDVRTIDFTGHVLTDLSAVDGVGAILYCPSEADDAGYRAAISAGAGGVTVDYFDARVATPSLALLAGYDAVHTWVNFAYLDMVGMGNTLAYFNASGGDVVLGVFCTYTSGNELSGRIMGRDMCPVISPLGTNHFTSSSYILDGTTCLTSGVTSATIIYRDILINQGAGVTDGHYADNEIFSAYRSVTPSGWGEVTYVNGAGALQLGGTGAWGKAMGNGATCDLS